MDPRPVNLELIKHAQHFNKMLVEDFAIDSKNVRREGDVLVSTYDYNTTEVDRSADGEWTVKPVSTEYEFRTNTRVPKLGCVICVMFRLVSTTRE